MNSTKFIMETHFKSRLLSFVRRADIWVSKSMHATSYVGSSGRV